MKRDLKARGEPDGRHHHHRNRAPRCAQSIRPGSVAAILAGLCALGSPGSSFAGEPIPPSSADEPTSPHPAGTEPLFADCGEGTLLGDWGGARSHLARNGVNLAGDYLGEVLGNVAGGMDQGAVYSGLVWINLDLDFERLGLWSGATVHASALYPHGDSLSQKYVGDLFTLSNIDARDAVVLFEAWYEQALWRDTLSIRLGQLAADQEFATTELGCLFINGTCGWPALIALNVPSPVYPYGALGARVAYAPSDSLAFRAAVFDGDPDTFDSNGSLANEHGVEYSLNEGALLLFEAEYGWNRKPEARGLPGTLKVGGWYHTAEFDDVHTDDSGLSLADPASSGIPQSHGGNGGGYLIVEQHLWTEPDADPSTRQGLGAFFRAGLSPADRNLLEAYLEGGLHYRGLLPGRDEDQAGIAVVYGQVSEDLRQFTRDSNLALGASEPIPDYEMVVETEYRIELRSGWTIQPGIHAVLHPGGSTAIDDALVLSLRTTLCF